MNMFTIQAPKESPFRERYECFDMSSLFVFYTLELLNEIEPSLVIPAHGYQYARCHYNAEPSNDPSVWIKYANVYRQEIIKETRLNMITRIADLALGFLDSADFRKTICVGPVLYKMIESLDKSFDGYRLNPNIEAIDMTLRHLDISDTVRINGNDVFTGGELKEMFASFLSTCISPIADDEDLIRRTSPTAKKYFTSVLSILFRLFKTTTDPYWYLWEQTFTKQGEIANDIYEHWLVTVPVRTAEAVLMWSGQEIFTRKSLETPNQIWGTVDRYLLCLKRTAD